MSAFKYFTNIKVVKHVKAREGTVRVQRRGPGVKTIEVEAHVALDCASINDGRSLTGSTNLIWTMVDCVASGRRPYINSPHKWQKFSS